MGEGMSNEHLDELIVMLKATIKDQDKQKQLLHAENRIRNARRLMEMYRAKGDEASYFDWQVILATEENIYSQLLLDFAEEERRARQG